MEDFISRMQKQRSPRVLFFGEIVVGTWEWLWRDSLPRLGTILGLIWIVVICAIAPVGQPEWFCRLVAIATFAFVWWWAGYMSFGYPQLLVGTYTATFFIVAWKKVKDVAMVIYILCAWILILVFGGTKVLGDDLDQFEL